ncbi:MAG: TIGR03118 family protein [Acidobacteria bacterium]|nr:MAG: TIGR03118 family protein [Acidobacteriota bacterium]
MNITFVRRRRRSAVLLAAAALVFVTPAVARPPAPNSYIVHNLVSDGSIPADHTDPHLVNAWGMARSGTSPWWVADNETAVSTLYNGSGTPQSLVVNVPGAPTGTVFNGGTSFVVTNGTTSGPARFLFASEDGTISGWSPAVSPTQAVIAVTSAAGAIYKGLAIATTPAGAFLYAADFHNARVDVFDGSFHPVATAGGFADPDLPSGFAPFGIQNLQGLIYVTYAQQDADAEDEVAGPGLGFVSVFDPDGHFRARVASGGPLNAPWGLAIAPADFGSFSGDLLVGNFGDGRINAYDLATFEAKGHLKTPDHKPLAIDGLWGIGFGNGVNAGPTTTLFFAAGPDDETHGLFGSVTAQE